MLENEKLVQEMKQSEKYHWGHPYDVPGFTLPHQNLLIFKHQIQMLDLLDLQVGTQLVYL